MRALKIAGFVLLGILAVVFLLGLVAPKKVETERSIVIKAPVEQVFNTVNDLSSWDSWSPWNAADPTVKNTVSNPSSGKDAYFTWTSEHSGSGKMTITESVPNESLKMEVNFDGQGSAKTGWTFTPEGEGVKASWSFSSKFPIPFNIMLLFTDFKAYMDKDYDTGLNLLKKVVEEQAQNAPAAKEYDIQVIDLPARYFVGTRATIPIKDITKFYAEHFGKPLPELKAKKIEMAGAPSGLYFVWDVEKQQTDMAAAIPVKTKVDIKGMTSFEVAAGKTLLIEYYGSYEDIGSAHEAMDKYMAANGLKMRTPVIEEYVTDPGMEPDPNKWLTKLYYPVE